MVYMMLIALSLNKKFYVAPRDEGSQSRILVYCYSYLQIKIMHSTTAKYRPRPHIIHLNVT